MIDGLHSLEGSDKMNRSGNAAWTVQYTGLTFVALPASLRALEMEVRPFKWRAIFTIFGALASHSVIKFWNLAYTVNDSDEKNQFEVLGTLNCKLKLSFSYYLFER